MIFAAALLLACHIHPALSCRSNKKIFYLLPRSYLPLPIHPPSPLSACTVPAVAWISRKQRCAQPASFQIRSDAQQEQQDPPARTALITKDGETSMNHAADRAIEYMQNTESKVLVDYNYYQLEQQKMAHTRLSARLLEQSKEINQHSKTIKKITKEACSYVEQVRTASNKIQDLAGVFLDPAALMCVSNMKQAIMEIHNLVVALQSSTATTSQFLEEKGMYSDDEVPEQVYSGYSDEDLADAIHQDMDDDYAHYVRSP